MRTLLKGIYLIKYFVLKVLFKVMEVRASRLVPGRVHLFGCKLSECRVATSTKNWSFCHLDLNMAAVNSGMWRALPDTEPDPWRGGWESCWEEQRLPPAQLKNFTSPPHWSVTHKIKHENRKKWFWSWGGPSHPRSLWKTFSIHLRKWPFTFLVHMLAGGPEVGDQGRWL